MIKDKTVFIIGAGGSSTYGYPTGMQLRKTIIEDFPEFSLKYVIPQSQHSNSGYISQWKSKIRIFCNTFSKSSTPSIDLFLSRNNNFIDIGKISIFSSILEAEFDSIFREDTDINEDWYFYLFNRMTEQLIDPSSWKDFQFNKISFITFNYDRSLEYFLYDSYINSFHDSDLKNLFRNDNLLKTHFPFKVHHIYGQIAPLPWQDIYGIEYKAKYDNTDEVILKVQSFANNIKVVNERNVNNYIHEKSLIQEADRIYFLGFGFAKENLSILGLPEILTENHKVYCTGLGLSHKQNNEIRKLFLNHKIKEDNIVIENMNCFDLLKYYL